MRGHCGTMARNRIIGPAAGDVHRGMMDGQDVRDAAAYRAMLGQELGQTSFGEGRREPPHEIHPMLRPSGLFVLALTALMIVGGLRLWQSGMFDKLVETKIPVAALKPAWGSEPRTAASPQREGEEKPLASLLPEPPKPTPEATDEGADEAGDAAE